MCSGTAMKQRHTVVLLWCSMKARTGLTMLTDNDGACSAARPGRQDPSLPIHPRPSPDLPAALNAPYAAVRSSVDHIHTLETRRQYCSIHCSTETRTESVRRFCDAGNYINATSRGLHVEPCRSNILLQRSTPNCSPFTHRHLISESSPSKASLLPRCPPS